MLYRNVGYYRIRDELLVLGLGRVLALRGLLLKLDGVLDD